MKKILIPLIFLYSISLSAQMLKSEKRGVSENAFTYTAEVKSLSKGCSWTYNWGIIPSTAVSSVLGPDGDMEFVPMAWNGNFDETALRTYLTNHPGVKYLLGFNEPNFASQASMTPSEAAAIWPRVEQIAADFNLKLVAPALNYSGSALSDGVVYSTPQMWMDAFLAAYPAAKYDYLALHCYMNSASATIGYVENYAKKYGKKVWLTEFCAWDGTVDSVTQLNTMVQKVQELELSDYVFRYAWFKAKGTNAAPYYRLVINPNLLTHLPAAGTLSTLGNVYVNMSSFDTTYYHSIGDTIAAKDYVYSVGITLENNTDAMSKEPIQIGSFDTGSYVDYMLSVPSDGVYAMNIRLASEAFFFNPKITVLCDGVQIASKEFTATGSVSLWNTEVMSLNLKAGKHKLRIRSSQSTTCKFNWFLLTPSDGINSYENNGTVMSVRYFDTRGVETSSPQKGIFIQKSKLNNGNTLTKKVVIQ